MRHTLRKNLGSVATAVAVILLLAAPAVAAPTSDATLPDQTIADIVQTRLAKRELDSQITVQVRDGVVTLTGVVDTLAEKQKAEMLAMKVDDVRRVVNDLSLDPHVMKSSQELAQEVSQAIDNYVLYGVFDWVEGSVQDGRVMLTGYVTEPWKKKDLTQAIESIPGVESIENSVEVLSPVNDDLRISLARQIYGDLVFLGRGTGAHQPIHIVVNDRGDVDLEGVVRNQVEKRVAETLARTHPWTFNVENHLMVSGDREASTTSD